MTGGRRNRNPLCSCPGRSPWASRRALPPWTPAFAGELFLPLRDLWADPGRRALFRLAEIVRIFAVGPVGIAIGVAHAAVVAVEHRADTVGRRQQADG